MDQQTDPQSQLNLPFHQPKFRNNIERTRILIRVNIHRFHHEIHNKNTNRSQFQQIWSEIRKILIPFRRSMRGYIEGNRSMATNSKSRINRKRSSSSFFLLLLKLRFLLKIWMMIFFFFLGSFFCLKTLTLIFFVVGDRDQSPSRPQKKASPSLRSLAIFPVDSLALREKRFYSSL